MIVIHHLYYLLLSCHASKQALLCTARPTSSMKQSLSCLLHVLHVTALACIGWQTGRGFASSASQQDCTDMSRKQFLIQQTEVQICSAGTPVAYPTSCPHTACTSLVYGLHARSGCWSSCPKLLAHIATDERHVKSSW